MAIVQFETLQKPIDARLLDAACIYWEVSEEFFKMKKKDADTQKRHIFFYLLKEQAGMAPSHIADRYGLHKSSVFQAIETIEGTKNIYPTIARTIREIIKIAETLQSTLVITDIRLQNVNKDGIHDRTV